ncbi:hypothetical protein KPATCC21470_0322 [Kitasatospora purpeofusca]
MRPRGRTRRRHRADRAVRPIRRRPARLHRDLGTVLHVPWAYERLRAEHRRWSRPVASSPWAVFRPQEFLDGVAEGVLRALDPSAWETEEHFWPMRADDCHMGELLE